MARVIPFNPTPEQQRVLALAAGRHVVLAPPGAGKTELLAHRVRAALDRGTPAESMLCVTFTNRAARNMRERVGATGAAPPFIGTLHQFGIRFLFVNGLIAANTALLDEEDAEQLVREAIEAASEEVGGQPTPKPQDAAAHIRLVNRARLRLGLGDAPRPAPLLDHIAARYEEAKRESCAIDFDDALQLTLAGLMRGSPARMRSYDWMQVDEVQDLSELQWAIVTRLVASDAHVVYFGDYDQAIYSFMGASHPALARSTRGAVEHHLGENFRSAPALIAAFEAYATANLPSRREQRLRPARAGQQGEGTLRVSSFKGTFDNEARAVAATVVPELARTNATTAVLTRSNADAEKVSGALSGGNIAHFKVSGFDLFRRRPIKDVMAFLRALQYPYDRGAWTRLLSVFGGVDSLRAARQLVNELFDVATSPADWLDGERGANPLDAFIGALSSGRCIVFDTETTGLDPNADEILQLAAAEVIDGRRTGRELEVFLRTDRDFTASARIHGITPETLARRGIGRDEGLRAFAHFAGDSPLLGHNVRFDLGILRANLRREAVTWEPMAATFDTLALSRRLHPRLASYRLGSLLVSLKLEGQNTHDAMDDVHATYGLAQHLAAGAVAGAAQRRVVAHRYRRQLDRLADSLAPLWQEVRATQAEEANLADVVERFFAWATTQARYRLDDKDREHVATLTGYLARRTPRRPLSRLLASLVPELSTYSESDLISDDDRVVVSTVHKAKGLQFEAVVVTSCVDDVYPNYYSKRKSDLNAVEEDARLLYVALTRAQRSIVVTMHDTAINRGGSFPRYPSPFLRFLSR